MAGESPDKVERGKSSGETTAEGRAVASSRGKKSGTKSSRKNGSQKQPGAAPSKTAKSAKPTPQKNAKSAKNAKPTKSAGPAGGAKSAAAPKSSKPVKNAEPARGKGGKGGTGTAPASAGDGSAESADTATAAQETAAAVPPAGAEQKTPLPAAADSGSDEAEAAGAGDGVEAGTRGEESGAAADPADPAGQAGGHGRNDERLKAAVAAWVAGSGDEPDEDSRGERDDSAAGERKTSQSAKGQGAAGSGHAGEGAVRASTGAVGAEDGVDHPTAMFRTVETDSGRSEDADDGEAAARRAERLTSAFFGPGRSGKPEDAREGGGDGEAAADTASSGDAEHAGGETAPDGDGGDGGAGGEAPGGEAPHGTAPDGAEPGGDASDVRDREDSESSAGRAGAPPGESAEPEPAAPRVDEPTAVFRTPAAGESESAAAAAGAPPGKTAREDQPTAVFRTVEPGEAVENPPAEKSGDAKSGDATTEQLPEPREPDATTQLARPVDPRLAVAGDGGTGRLPVQKKEPEKASEPRTAAGQKAEPKAEPDTEQKTETGKTEQKTGTEPRTDSDGDSDSGREEESDSERTSQFVPLRSADAPPRPARKPDGLTAPPKPLGRPAPAPAAGELPAEATAPGLSEAERTRQEVRPDQAPLDLLAQLTNTPPPPETPLRTAARRVKIWTPLVLLLVVLFAVAQAVRPLPETELSLTASPTHSFQGPKPSVPWPAEGQATLDVQGLGSFGSSGKQKPVPIASVAKVMTAYVLLRDHPVRKGEKGAFIPVDKKAEEEAGLSAQNESTVEVEAGDKISEREAVEALMIASANNVARLVARWDAGSEKAFAKKMNATAKDLGMKNTHYTDPSGLTSSTVSTAEDQVKLAKKAMGVDLFRETVRLPGYQDGNGEQHGNWNKLVPLDGVVGIKTGTTTKAGGNLLFAAEKEIGGTKQLIVGAVLGQYRPSILDTVLEESKKLIDTAQDALRAQKVVQKGEVVGYVDDQLGGRTPVVATRDVTAVGWSGLKVKLALTDDGKPLPHKGSRGDRAGTLTVGDGPGQVRVPLALKEDMAEPGFGAKLTRIL